MQTLNATETGSAAKAGDLMAAWRASGGAMDGRREAAAADDGLAAMANSNHPGCYADDGLEATSYSASYRPCADDGLAAMGPTGRRGCFADDGLAATAYSNRWPQCADDGLAAMAYSNRWPQCADDGLAAMAYSYPNNGCYGPAG